ncbi:MAG: oligosaccharide flippase family protein, partial [Bacteroidota bacterium]|nr:oligosaccharide flippase family protein [Bacteroidota bacterium]
MAIMIPVSTTNTESLLKKIIKKTDLTLLKPMLYRQVKLTTVNIIGVVLLFFTNNFLVKLLGEQDYGYYVIVNVWIQFFAVVIVFGMDDLFIATLPKFYFDTQRRKNTPGVFYWAVKICLAVLVLLVGSLLIAMQAGYFHPVLTENKLIFFSLLASLSFLLLIIAFFRGINKVMIGQLVDKFFRPAVMFLMVAGMFFLQKKVLLQDILWLQVFALLCGLVGMLIVFFNHFKTRAPTAGPFDKSLKKNVTFLGISLLYMLSVRLDIMFLTDAARSEDVGYYNIAARISDLVGYPLTAINLIAPTLLAKEFHQNKSRVLPLLRSIILLAIGGSVIGVLFVVIAGKSVLLFFGQNFTGAFWPLIILSFTHLLAAFALPFNTVLMVS